MRKLITNEEYFFSSLNDMYKFLTSDNIDDFLIDFGSMLKDAVAIREEVLKQVSKLSDEEKEAFTVEDVLEISSFSWIDDGEHNEGFSGIDIIID